METGLIAHRQVNAFSRRRGLLSLRPNILVRWRSITLSLCRDYHLYLDMLLIYRSSRMPPKTTHIRNSVLHMITSFPFRKSLYTNSEHLSLVARSIPFVLL